jgi:hypothetical protein
LSLGSAQGCQIFIGTFYQKFIPNDHKLWNFLGAKYQNGENLYRMDTKYTEWPQTIPNEKNIPT